MALPHLWGERPPIVPVLPAEKRDATAEGLVVGRCHRGHSARSGSCRATRGYGSATRCGRARRNTARARGNTARAAGSRSCRATRGYRSATRSGRARRITTRADGSVTRTRGVRAGRRGAGLGRVVALLLFVAPVEAHGVIFDREGATNARRGVENDVHALDHRGADAIGFRHALSATQRGAERTEVAEADAAPLLEAVDNLDLESIDHGFDVGRSEGTFLFDALDDFDAVVSRCGDELRVEEDVAGLDVLAANNVVG